MATNEAPIVVVGGGVIGAACAYFLCEAGHPVTLIDQQLFGKGCSHGNCGYVSPSHALPLAGPGALWRTLKTLLSPNSPLKVRWRWDPAMWQWFWQFARRCNREQMLTAGQGIVALLNSSRELYQQLVDSVLTDVEWDPRGMLFVFRSREGMEHHAEVDALLRAEFNLPADRYDADALLALEPALKPGCAGALHYRNDVQLRPDKLMSSWHRLLTARGVTIRERCELIDLDATGRTVRQLTTSRGTLTASQVVIATGAWTPRLQRLLRRPVAILPGKGYSLTMPRPAICPTYPMLFEEHRVGISPMQTGYRIGSTMEFTGYDTTLNPRRLQLLRDGAALYLRDPFAEPIQETWYGWRPMTPDGLPFIGSVPAFDNVWLAAGHGMLGVSMSPATGKLLAELVTKQTPHIDPAPYAVARQI